MIKIENLPEDKEVLTPREAEVYNGLLFYLKEHRTPPASRELAKLLGKSYPSVLNHFDSLAEKGWVNRKENVARGTLPVDFKKKGIDDLEFYQPKIAYYQYK